MRIVITGCVGTGKTSVARVLSELLKMPVVNDKAFCIEQNIGTIDKFGEVEVDLEELQQTIQKNYENQSIIFEGHLFSLISLNVDIVIILHTALKELEQRLLQRRYPKYKIEDNIIAEGINYCKDIAQQKYSCKTCDIDTTMQKPKEIAAKILRILNNKDTCDEINHEEELVNYLRRK